MSVNQKPRPATVLLAVLVVVVLLSLAAYQYVELMTAEYRAADSATRSAQARSFAASGVHYIAAALADANTVSGTFGSNIYDNADVFRSQLVQDGVNERLRGRFSLMAPPYIDDAINGGSTPRFGVTDESGKININALVTVSKSKAKQILALLPNMTDEIADAIIDWIDTDDEPQPNGAENEYYGSMGYRCKNGPLDSVEELLLVRGLTSELLFGADTNRNGKLDDSENPSNGFDPGWAAYLTAYSRELNRDSTGQPRININDSDLSGLYDQLSTAISEEVATWIVAYRLYGDSTPKVPTSGGTTLTKAMLGDLAGKTGPVRIPSIASLLTSTVSIPQPGSGSGTVIASSISASGTSTTITTTTRTTTTTTGSTGNSTSGGRGGTGGGGTASTTYLSPLALDSSKQQEILPLLYDKCWISSDAEISPRVNINTAPRAVLTAVLTSFEGQFTDADVQSIIDARPAPGQQSATNQDISWMVSIPGLTPAKLSAIERYITTTTQTYRVQSLGYFDRGGPVVRIEAVVDTNGGRPRILMFRDLTELGRGFDVPR